MKTQDKRHSIPEVLSELETLGLAGSNYMRTGCCAGIFISSEKLLEAVKRLRESGYILEDISGVDVQEGILVVYHFDRLDRSERIAVRVLTSHETPMVPSIVAICSGADWHERECYDFFGVIFDGHPNLKPLLLPDDLGFHPLIKEKNRQSLYALLPFDQMVFSDVL